MEKEKTQKPETGARKIVVEITCIELGQMSNLAEDRLMQSTSYQKKMVKGMANGIKAYLLGQ